MKGNALFADAPEALGDLEKDLPEYNEVNYTARWGDEETRFKRKNLKTRIIVRLNILAEYVTGKAGGDPAIMTGAGFEVNRPKGSKPMSPIKELKVKADITGEAVTEVKRVAGAKVYIHQFTPDPLTGNNVWVNKVTTSPTCTFTGLTSKEKYWFQVIAVGINDQQAASTLASRVIQ